LITTLEWKIWSSVIVVWHVDARCCFEMKLVGILNATITSPPQKKEKLVIDFSYFQKSAKWIRL
jgi:hypothetical protein